MSRPSHPSPSAPIDPVPSSASRSAEHSKPDAGASPGASPARPATSVPQAAQSLSQRLADGRAVVAGVLSGTSADGIDVALFHPPVSGLSPLSGHGPESAAAPPSNNRASTARGPRLLAFTTVPFPASLGRTVRELLDGGACTLAKTALAHRDLGRAFGAAVAELAHETGLQVELVGSHGQTVYHHDGEEPSGPATLQLGDGDHVARAAGAPVVSDFRQADVAAGGEGAPLSALVDHELYGALPRPAAILNLGGIANATLLGAQGLRLAFDSGPANALLDGLARRFLDQPFDRDGACAAQGRVHPSFVAELLEHPFFARELPRSTGRDTFGEAWLDGVLERARVHGILTPESPADLFASAVELIAQSVAGSLERAAKPARGARAADGVDASGIGVGEAPHDGPPKRLVLCGGGAHHLPLVEALARATGLPVERSEGYGVDGDAREALVFGLLAVRFVLGVPSATARATGGAPSTLLGKWSPAVAEPRSVR